MEEKDKVQEEEVKDQNVEQEAQEESTEEVQEEVQEELSSEELLQKRFDELNDKYLRLYSDFDNFRKRTQKEKLDIINGASGEVLKSLLPIADDFERAIANNAEVADADALKEGFTLIQQKFMKTLEAKGLKAMDSKGQPFDAELHEAITNIPAPEDKDKGTCFDVIEKGYYLNDKVLRYAKVVVAQ